MFYITWLMKEMTRAPLSQCLAPLAWITNNFKGEWKDRLVGAFLERNDRLVPDSAMAAYDLVIS
jgi:hypothetical protein